MERVLAENPADIRARFVLGASLAENGKHEEALRHMTEVAASKSELASTPTSFVTMGRAYLALGDAKKAEESFQKVTDRAAVGAAFAQVGARAFNAGDLDEAVRLFERAVQAIDRDPDVLYGLGLCLVKQGQLPKGMAVFKTLVTLAPDHPKAKLASDLLKTLDGKPQR